MRKTSILSAVTALVGLNLPTHAALQYRGTDMLGNRLIYDTDLNITWYDFTNSSSPSSWYSHLEWASGLTVNFGGVVYDDWRLPTTAIIEDPPIHRYDGTTTYGFNISSSEMGHLFYVELGNLGRYDASGFDRGPDNRLLNTGPFTDLQPHSYYSGTSTGPFVSAYFQFSSGEQYQAAKEALGGTGLYSIAVREGNVIPEPASLSMLLVACGMLLERRRLSRKKA
jgi:hypothetical protein